MDKEPTNLFQIGDQVDYRGEECTITNVQVGPHTKCILYTLEEPNPYGVAKHLWVKEDELSLC